MRGLLLILAAALVTLPAHAEEREVRVPAGRVSEAAAEIARQTRTTIVIADPVLASRRVPAIRGRLSAEAAVEKLARVAGARAVRGSLGWRLVSQAPSRQPRTRPPMAPATPAPQPPPVVAQDIVVLASKRDVRLRDYAGHVTVIDGEDLSFGGPGGTERIAERVAAVTSTHLGNGRNKLFIRGIADSSFTGPTQSTVGQYLGDLRLSYNAPDPDLRLTDMAAVEVLEGPQGTLYGAGSLGGIIRLIPNAPEPGEVAASAGVGAALTEHGAPGADATGMFNLPLANDTAALRVAFSTQSEGGYIDKPMLDRTDVNRTRILGGRAFLRLRPAEGWTVDAIILGQRLVGRDSQYADRHGPPLTRIARVREGFASDYGQGQLVVNGELGRVRLRSSTGLAGQQLEERYDATAPNAEPRIFLQQNTSRMLANETRFWLPMDAGMGWVLGFSYTNNRTRLTRGFGDVETQTALTGVLNRVSEVTLYGEISRRLSDGLVATAGGRLTNSRLGGAAEDVAPALTLAGAAITAERNETVFLPSVSVAATPLPSATLYLKYQEGFRPGGLAIDGDFVRRFRSDRTRTFELGARHGRAGAGRFDFAASFSFTRWTDIQADFIDSRGLPSTANIGDGRIWTISLAGGGLVLPELRLEGAVSWNRSEIHRPVLQLLAHTSHVPNIARLNARAAFDYERQIGSDLQLTAKGWARYVGPSRLGVGPELGDRQGDYLDSGLTVRVGRPGLGLTLGITNLFDNEGNRFALGTPIEIGRDQVTPLRPRTIRLGLDAAF